MAGLVGIVAVGGARIASDLAPAALKTARVADDVVAAAAPVASKVDDVGLIRHVEDAAGGALDVGGAALDVGDLLLSVSEDDAGPLALSAAAPLDGVWQSHAVPEGLPFLWSCQDQGDAAVPLCALSFEEADTLSMRVGMGSLFFAERDGETLLCRRVHEVSAPLPGRSMDETLKHLNEGGCHAVIDRSPTRLRLRTPDDHEYSFSRRL